MDDLQVKKNTDFVSIDIPEGWEFVRIGSVGKDEFYLNPFSLEIGQSHVVLRGDSRSDSDTYYVGRVIVRRVDLATRLREEADRSVVNYAFDLAQLMREAADEIERLSR